MVESRAHAAFEWVSTHLRAVLIGVVVLAVVAVPLAAGRSDEEPNFNPEGEIYDTLDLAEERFESSSPVLTTPFIVEARDGDALTRDVLLELKQRSDALRDDPELSSSLASDFAFDLGVEIDGVWSLADEVDAALPGGLSAATDADVKLVLVDILGESDTTSPLRRVLSQRATAEPGEIGGESTLVWSSPAFMAHVALDKADFPEAEDDSFGDAGPEAQEWLRDAQDVLKGGEVTYEIYGVAIDGDLLFEELAGATAPFILLAIVAIVLLIGGLLRSYWAAALVALGLGVTNLVFQGLTTAMGFKGGLLLGFIVPIALISFGVDFFAHASGRTREEQVHGASRQVAYPRGMTAVFGALALAAVSSAAAFASNAVSGIEAITQFGIGAGVALVIAFLLLGVVAPKAVLAVEDAVGEAPLDRGRMVSYKLGFLLMALVGGAAVTATVVFPVAGAVALVVFGLAFVALPFRLTRRLYRRAADAGRPTGTVVKGAGHSFRPAGDVVHFLARWRVFTIPVTLALAVAGVIAFTQVESRFEFSDFFPKDSDFIQSVDLLEEHYGETTGGGEGLIYVEGRLAEPAALLAMHQAVADLDAADQAATEPFLSRDFDGELVVGDNALTLAREAVSSTTAAAAIEATTGMEITDTDGDGLPDTAAQVAAVFTHALDEGIPNESGSLAFRPESVSEFLAPVDGDTWATPLAVVVPTLFEDSIILDARGALEDAAAGMEAGPAAGLLETVNVSGEAIVSQDSLDAFTDAMLLALPVAFFLCLALAALFMRSLKYGLVAVTPILLVIGWVYGFMYLAGYTINVVTATIAAIAVGTGIDYATHFTMRFREEFADEPSRFPALRRAGEGTGAALAISALSSIIGFAVMAMAPMPIFSTFGVLTAVMIFFSLLVALLVLPSLLLLVTRSRKGEERERLVLDLTRGRYDYEPHSRETALRRGAAGAAPAEQVPAEPAGTGPLPEVPSPGG